MKSANVSLLTMFGLTAGLLALTNGACSVSGDGLGTQVDNDSPGGGNGMNVDAGSSGGNGTGGIMGSGTGGLNGTGGVRGTGGLSGTGGGQPNTGGKGGSPQTGGVSGKGGSGGKGGSPATGGVSGTGGTSTGGTQGTGGIQGTGGMNTGGTPATGGMNSGGTPATGGTTGNYDTPATPEAIKCGNEVCDEDEYCCEREAGLRCVRRSAECGTNTFLGCDDRSDCQLGTLCCAEVSPERVRSLCVTPVLCASTANVSVLCANDRQCEGDQRCCQVTSATMSLGQCRNSCAP